MITWAEIAILILKIADAIINALNQDKLTKAGSDAEIAKISAAILAKTEAGKVIFEKVRAMDETAVDVGLHDLEPK